MHRVLPLLVLLTSFPAAAQFHGFLDLRGGARLDSDPVRTDTPLAETRLQVETAPRLGPVDFQLRADLIGDAEAGTRALDLETGQGWLDLREAYGLWSPTPFTDIKVGRQVLTWGTGDLLFINDFFPKDWVSFFIGRDEEYLKAPSDAVMVGWFPEAVSLEWVYTPRFDADRGITGERLSFDGAPPDGGAIPVNRPDDWFDDDEWAARAYRTFGAVEAALYAYQGFWKSPAGQDPVSARATHPRLRAYGASLRGTVAGGIGNAEIGYLDSLDDPDGDHPLVRNSEWRGLVGYQRELIRNVQLGLQAYAEVIDDQEALAGQPTPDEWRQVLTARLTWMAREQTVTTSLFTFWSPTDEDGYLRPSVGWSVNDDWHLSAGANLFFGREQTTFFGQFEDNNNLYAALRRHF